MSKFEIWSLILIGLGAISNFAVVIAQSIIARFKGKRNAASLTQTRNHQITISQDAYDSAEEFKWTCKHIERSGKWHQPSRHTSYPYTTTYNRKIDK